MWIKYTEVPLAENYDCIAKYAKATINVPFANKYEIIAQYAKTTTDEPLAENDDWDNISQYSQTSSQGSGHSPTPEVKVLQIYCSKDSQLRFKYILVRIYGYAGNILWYQKFLEIMNIKL